MNEKKEIKENKENNITFIEEIKEEKEKKEETPKREENLNFPTWSIEPPIQIKRN